MTDGKHLGGIIRTSLDGFSEVRSIHTKGSSTKAAPASKIQYPPALAARFFNPMISSFWTAETAAV